uniref:Uncharacterized protein n=1 Tax=Arundo donax TaxID=35708 RepID=A0A0A8ZFD6_ARUDO
MVYVEAPSSHSANTNFSHSMAFGSGSIALSLPLAAALLSTSPSRSTAGCMDARTASMPTLWSSPSPASMDFTRGNSHGLLVGNPIAPFISIHHLGLVDPIYPGLSSQDLQQ